MKTCYSVACILIIIGLFASTHLSAQNGLPTSTRGRAASASPSPTPSEEKPPQLISDGGKPVGSAEREKPRIRTFGSSLNGLKWDSEKQAAIDINTSTVDSAGADSDDVIRVETRLVVSDVLVLDQKGRSVEGLTQNDFIVNEDNQPQQISHFSLGDDVKVARSIVLVIDYSISQLAYLDKSIDAAKTLIDKLGPKDRMAIVTDDVKLLVDFTRNKAELKGALDGLKAKAASGQTGGSAQFSALMATLKEMFDSEDIRPIVIFQTDGDELQFLQPPSIAVVRTKEMLPRIKPFSIEDINRAAEKSRATIYTVLPGVRLIGLPEVEQLHRARIAFRKMFPENKNPQQKFIIKFANDALMMQTAAANVADSSGGKSFFLEQPGQASDIYSQMLDDVNRRYVIGYYPANKATDGKRRKVSIEVRGHPEYVVDGRKYYIAPGAK